MKVLDIEVARLRPPALEMRETMTHEGLDELRESMRALGLQQPLIVEVDGENFRIVAGARRHECARSLGWATVPCVVVDGDDREKEVIKIHENLKREDVDPVEEGFYYRRLVEERGFSMDDLIKATGRSQNYIDGRLELTQWDEAVRVAITAKKLPLAVGRELQKFRDPEARGRYLVVAVDNGASARTVESWRLQWEAQEPVGQAAPSGAAGEQPAPAYSPPVEYCTACGRSMVGMLKYYVLVDQGCKEALEKGAREAAGEPPRA